MNILITGASSGIGEALALEYAKRGADALFLCGRNRERLDGVAARCREAGVKRVETEILDVANESKMADWIVRCDAIAPLEVVHANAGVSTGIEDEANVRRTFATNIGGVLNTVLPVIELYRKKDVPRRRKQIILTASIAGYHGLPPCPAYSGSKAGVKAWGEGLRGMLAREGIWVSIICPGFVRSRITDKNTCPMPFFWEADKAARVIVNRASRNIGTIAFPWPLRFGSWFMSVLPNRMSNFFYGRLPQKFETK